MVNSGAARGGRSPGRAQPGEGAARGGRSPGRAQPTRRRCVPAAPKGAAGGRGGTPRSGCARMPAPCSGRPLFQSRFRRLPRRTCPLRRAWVSRRRTLPKCCRGGKMPSDENLPKAFLVGELRLTLPAGDAIIFLYSRSPLWPRLLHGIVVLILQ